MGQIYYRFLLLSESSLCLSSASSSCSNCSASRWVFSSLSRTPSGLRCRMGPERLMERLVHRLRDGELMSIGPGIDRFSVERLAKKWRTSTGLKILGELHGEAYSTVLKVSKICIAHHGILNYSRDI
jgi:hypothetical protein